VIFDENSENVVDYGTDGLPDWWLDPETDEEISGVKKVGYN